VIRATCINVWQQLRNLLHPCGGVKHPQLKCKAT
jgi:hypothetical protein